jgi:hypothetical protein
LGKNNKHNAVFQHIPTEIDDVVIQISKPSLLFEVSDEGKKWVDSVYMMTFDEKVGQLFMLLLTE